MTRLKKQVIRDLDVLSSGELLVVQQLIEQFKRARSGDDEPAGGRSAARRARAALAELPGSLAAAVTEGREERV